MGNRIISSELMTIREELRKQQSISLEATKGASVGISGIVSVETFNQLQIKYNGMEQKLQNVNKDIDRLNAENKEYNKMNNMVKNENVSLAEKIKQISKENESLKQQKNAKEKEQDVEMDKFQKERDGYLKRMNTLKAINKKLSEFHD